MAKRESRTISELFREAFRVYRDEKSDRLLKSVHEYAEEHNPLGYTERDVARAIKRARASGKVRAHKG